MAPEGERQLVFGLTTAAALQNAGDSDCNWEVGRGPVVSSFVVQFNES